MLDQEVRDFLNSIKRYAWAFRNLIGQDKEWRPTVIPVSFTSSFTSAPLHELIAVDCTSGAVTATLETAVGADGREHTFIKTDSSSNALTLDGNGSETIGGSATVSTSKQYGCFVIKARAGNWDIVRIDLANAIGVLLAVNGGTGFASYAVGDVLYANTTTTLAKLADVATGNAVISGGVGAAPSYGKIGLTTHVSGILPAANGGQDTQALISYGGLNFNGTTTYLDTNALTGIADGKKGTWVGIVRFANAASASEQLHDATGQRFRVTRTSTGNIQITAANSAATNILNQSTTGTPCSAAGTYIICISFDLGTGQSTMQIVINGTAAGLTNTTFTNDTIDYTTTEHSLGATVAGANFFAGDFYVEWFDPTSNMDFTVASNLRKFFDVNLVPNFLGWNGELPTGTAPVSFLGYGAGAGWVHQRGTSTSQYTQNGAIANATTALKGMYSTPGGDSVGYPLGSGGTVTQQTNKATAVTLHKSCGDITMNNAALNAGVIVSFTLTNDAIAATDTLSLNHVSGGTPCSYTLNARCAAGSATIDVRNNTAGSLSEAIVIRYGVVKTQNA